MLLDTDTLSELCRGNLRVAHNARQYLVEFGRLTLSSVTVFERLRGYAVAIHEGKPFHRQLQCFEELVSNSLVIPFDEAAAAVSATIWASVARPHRQFGDILIAGVAIARGLPLVTRNKRDFEPMSAAAGNELKLLDWTKTQPS